MFRSPAITFILSVLTFFIAQTQSALATPGIKEVKLKNRKFVNGTINARTSDDFQAGSKVLLGIPGGPGIPGHYMDQITADLAKRIGAIPIVVDLPNHGSSKRLNLARPMTYPEAKIMLLDFLQEIYASGATLFLFGHSLGALVALDLLRSQAVPIAKTILVGMPIEFERNPAFIKFLSDSSAPAFSDEPGFARWWRTALPAYFYRDPTQEEIELLTHNTSWFANEQFTAGLPSAGATASALKPELLKDIIYIEGEKEIIIPQDNFRRITNAFPNVPKSTIPKTGHFPMLENSQDLLNEVTRHFGQCSELLTPTSAVNNK